jgi:hypothetical protein
MNPSDIKEVKRLAKLIEANSGTIKETKDLSELSELMGDIFKKRKKVVYGKN